MRSGQIPGGRGRQPRDTDALLARYSRHVYAYEPNPQLASQLRRAFDRRVTVFEAALSDTSGSTVLKMPYYRGVEMHGLASIAQDFKWS